MSVRRVMIGFAIGIALSLAFIVPAEIARWNALTGEPGTAWLFDMNVDTTPFALLVILTPLMWVLRQPLMSRPPRFVLQFINWLVESPRSKPNHGMLHLILAAGFVACVSLVSCLRVAGTPVTADGVAFGALPPAFHDEYSYLFQAETIAAGRLSFASHPTAARIFDQMHVLNEGHFASRYFPGTGIWLTPFLMLGNPFAGQWLATVCVCVFVFLIGRELSCNGVGLLAGILAALSPGLVLFGNLLLAHQPTLLGLRLFIYAFLRLQRLLDEPAADLPRVRYIAAIAVAAGLSGFGLAFAMLCRPMTAAGVGFPFGVWVAAWLIRHARRQSRVSAVLFGGFAIPLTVGFGIVAGYNASTTGSAFTTPYYLYTELFTPGHMFGFDNVERARPLISDRTLHSYNDLAVNLNAELAIQNVGHRFLASWQWTLGLVACVLLGSVFLVGAWRNLDRRWWLIVGAIVSLHAVHVPYWFDGIFHWHYVFESGILWCLIVSAAVQLLCSVFRKLERPWMIPWIGLLVAASITTNNLAIPPFQGVSRLNAGINQVAFSRIRYFNFRQLLEQQLSPSPALVLVRHLESERHIDYVSNHPSLNGPILIGRLPADARTSEEDTVRLAAKAFPDRRLFSFDAASGRLDRIR